MNNSCCNSYNYCYNPCVNQCNPCWYPCGCICCPTGDVPTAPPAPPAPVASRGEFVAAVQELDNGEHYALNAIDIKGAGIEIDPATNIITLAPGNYEFTWTADTVLQAGPSNLSIGLVDGAAPIPGTDATANNVQAGVATRLQANGHIVGQSFALGFATNPAVRGDTSATLTITQILP